MSRRSLLMSLGTKTRTKVAYTNGTTGTYFYMPALFTNVGANFTVEFRAKVMNTGQNTALMDWSSADDSTHGDPLLYLNIVDNLNYRGYSAGYTPHIPYNNNVWEHFAITQDAALNMQYFHNGVLKQTATAATNRSGSHIYLGNGFAGFGVAQFADLRVWNKVRTAAEITETKDKTIPGAATNLFANWPLDGDLLDKSGGGKTGIIKGQATFVAF